MEQSKQIKLILLTVVGLVALVTIMVGMSFAFFSYTRTGIANNLSTGTISFNSTNTTINLSSAFPVSAATASGTSVANANVGIATVNITGQTSYPGGIDFVVTTVDVSNNIGSGAGKLPVKIIVTGSGLPTGTTLLGSGTATTITEDAVIASGHIPGNNTAVNGTITIKGFIDGESLLITDTASGGAVVVEGYTNNTDTTGKTVLTTAQWNALNSVPASFKIKVESYEHIAQAS